MIQNLENILKQDKKNKVISYKFIIQLEKILGLLLLIGTFQDIAQIGFNLLNLLKLLIMIFILLPMLLYLILKVKHLLRIVKVFW